MSKPMLPNQNSRYWGHDLNNYLLSLASDIDEVKRKINLDTFEATEYILENIGFISGTYLLNVIGTNWIASTINEGFYSCNSESTFGSGLHLSGRVVCQTTSGSDILSVPFELKNYDIFSDGINILKFKYVDGILQKDESTTTLAGGFWNVYLRVKIDAGVSYETVLSQDVIADYKYILIGTLDAVGTSYIFAQRAYSAGKPFYTSIKDCYDAKVSVQGQAVRGTKLPLVSDSVSPDQYIYYYMFVNGINPTLPLLSEEINATHFDCKKIRTDSTGWFVWDDIHSTLRSTTPTIESQLNKQRQYDLYISITGKIFAFEHNLNQLYTDYRVSSMNDLRLLPQFKAGSLVYMGTFYCFGSDTGMASTYSVSQSGGMSPVLNATHYNWNKLVLEDKEIHSINDSSTNTQLGIRSMSLTQGGIEYILSTVEDDITTVTFATSFTEASGSDTLKLNFLLCWYTTASCKDSDRLISSGNCAFTAGTTYYFKTSGTLLTALLGSNATEITWNNSIFKMTKSYEPNIYKFAINPSRAVSTTGTHPGYGIINLNIPASDDLMVPIFDRNYVTTTTTDLVFTQSPSQLTICPGKIEITHTDKDTSTLSAHQILFANDANKASITKLGVNIYTNSADGTKNSELILSSGLFKIGKIETNSDYLQISKDTISLIRGRNEPCKIALSSTTDNSTIQLNSSTIQVNDNVSLQVADTSLLTMSSSALLIQDLIKIGGSTSSGETNYKLRLYNDGHIYCAATHYTSDKRYKTNIIPIQTQACLDAVKNIDTFTYQYIDSNEASLGVMAQDIEQYLPEYANLLVSEDKDGKKYVEEHKLVFILWQVVKELLMKHND